MADVAIARSAASEAKASGRRTMRTDTGIAWLLTMPAILAYLAMILLPLLAVLALAFTSLTDIAAMQHFTPKHL